MKLSDYLGVKEAAELCGVSRATIRNWGDSGKIREYRNPNNSYRLYLKDDIQKLLDSIKINHQSK